MKILVPATIPAENPKVVNCFFNICKTFSMQIEPYKKISHFAKSIAKAYDNNCNDSLISEGGYGRELMNNTPKAKGISKEVLRDININRGDAVIMVG